MRFVSLLLLIAVLLLFTSGCSESPPVQPATVPATVPATSPPATPAPLTTTIPPTRTASVSDNTILIVKNEFRPANITVKTGSTVRWVNQDDHPHRIEFADKSFQSSTYLLGSSQSASQRFDHAGTYDFSCTIHPYMKGAVTVGV